MENSSHAILMVAGIAIAMAIVGALLFAFNSYSKFKKEQQASVSQEQITEYNKSIESYNKRALKGNEVLSLMNLIRSKNRQNEDYDEQYPEMSLYICFIDLGSNNNPKPSYDRNHYRIDSNLWESNVEEKSGEIYAKINDNFPQSGNADSITQFKSWYFQCIDIEYQEGTGYIEKVYMKQTYDRNKR